MDYTQDGIATLHDYGEADPPAPLSRTAVVVPVTEQDFAGLAPERVFSSLSSLPVARVIVPIRAPEDRIPAILEWLRGFDLPMEPLWCNAPPVEALLDAVGMDGTVGKGSDVWLALGLASEYEFVALHDADVRTHEPRDIRKLVAPLDFGFEFVKGYYARVENRQLYGRLSRLFVAPLLDTLETDLDAEIVRYLASFRYPLAGEMGLTGSLARQIRVPRRWGLEIGILGQVFDAVGFDGTAQVDLGRYEHDHRAVAGPTGLSDMSTGVARALFRVLEDQSTAVEYDSLRERYRASAIRYVARYRADAWFNDFEYDQEAEYEQVESYATAIERPSPDDRLPPWNESGLSRSRLKDAGREALERID